MVDRLGENSDRIVKFLGKVMRRKYSLRMQTVFMDWTSFFFEAPQQGIVRVGYSRDHRPDRPRVTIGLSMDRDSGMPVGLTVNAGNIPDAGHFEDTFKQIRPLLPKDAVIVFDNGAYSRKNSALLDEAGIGFVTRQQLNTPDDRFAKTYENDRIPIDDDISYQIIEGNLGRKRYPFRSNVRRTFILDTYRPKSERDYGEMEVISKGIDAGRKPGKKYRNPDRFVNTRLSCQFPMKVFSRELALDMAATSMVTGREGLFVLSTNREFPARRVLGRYCARGRAEAAFRDLKHGIDRRPAGCTSEMAIKGRILVSFLALFCMSMARFLYPPYRNVTAESL